MTDKQQQTPLNVEPHINALTNLNVGMSEEEFVLTLFSGNSARRYAMTPKHAKRVLLLLKKFVTAYEEKFDNLETKLPEGGQAEATAKGPIGFREDQ